MPPAGFEPAIPASERPQIYALDRAANGIGILFGLVFFNTCIRALVGPSSINVHHGQ